MLIRRYKAGETLALEIDGEPVTVRIIEIIGDRVRFAIEAPQHVSVWRQEVLERMKGEA